MLIMVIKCKAKNIHREITFAWHNIGSVWTLDESDIELISRN